MQAVLGAEVVDAGHAGQQLEAQRRIVTQHLREIADVLGRHVERQLVPVDDDLADRLRRNSGTPRCSASTTVSK